MFQLIFTVPVFITYCGGFPCGWLTALIIWHWTNNAHIFPTYGFKATRCSNGWWHAGEILCIELSKLWKSVST